MFGFVSSALGSGAMSAISPYFWRSSEISPKSSARSGHASTQMGCLPSATRSAHMSHRTAFFISSSTFGALYGHAMAHVPHPMHFSGSLFTMPVSGSFEMAPCGHFAIQAGLSQWLHATET